MTEWLQDSLYLLLAIFLVLLNGFFVAAEFSLVKARISRLAELVAAGVPFAKSALWMRRRLDDALSVCQLGITIASLGLGWVGEPAFASLIEPGLHAVGIESKAVLHATAFAIAFSIITVLHLVIGELAPKTVAIRQPETLARWCSPPLRFFWLLSYPVLQALNGATNLVLRPLGIITGGDDHDQPHSEIEIQALVAQSEQHGEVTRAEKSLIQGVFAFDDLICRRVMVPRVDVAYYDINQPLEEFLQLARRTKHTRYPVCDGSLDTVLGVVHIKDIALANGQQEPDIRSLMRPPRFVPETLAISKLLRQFQATHQLLAIVVDEYGTTSGIVTLENVLEPIVGPVADEFDVELPEIVPETPGVFTVQGRTGVDVVAERLGLTFDAGDSDTLSGYLTEHLGRVPEKGDTIEIDGATAEVIEARKARAELVRFRLADAPADAAADVPAE